MTVDEMIEELEENYEAAGYADFYERVLKDKTDEEIKEMYDNFVKQFAKLEEEYYKEREEYLKSKECEN